MMKINKNGVSIYTNNELVLLTSYASNGITFEADITIKELNNYIKKNSLKSDDALDITDVIELMK